jgi:subtilisin family serine protease
VHQRIASCFKCALIFLLMVCAAAHTQSAPASSQPPTAPRFNPHQILIKPKPGTSLATLANFHAAQKGEVVRTFEGIGNLQIVRVSISETVPGFIRKYESSGLVEFAEPDYVGQTFATTPNDTYYANGTLWGLNKIDAPGGWDVRTSASNIVVAVLDTGIRYTHEDLAANMWVNPNDGGHGWNSLTGTNNPYDDATPFSISHGTLIAGVLGAVGNNGKGVVGVAWQVQIMACQWLTNSNGKGNLSDCITCIDYARTNGARIINASWGFPTNSLALSNAVNSLRDAGIILVAACGNETNNIDTNPTYPSGYHLDNIVSVASTTTNDTLAAYSNYGATNVHLAAPGEQIYSTISPQDFLYGFSSGTSMAAPYVSGTLALMLAKYPTETYQQIISRLLNATDPVPALSGKCVTGGRLNLHKALSPPISLTATPTVSGTPFQLRLSGGPNRTCVIEVTTNLTSWTPIFTNTTSTNGTFDFIDNQSTNTTRRFYRAVSSP